jgi:hypothetical protein
MALLTLNVWDVAIYAFIHYITMELWPNQLLAGGRRHAHLRVDIANPFISFFIDFCRH